MIIKEKRLISGLEDWRHRNQLIRELVLEAYDSKDFDQKMGLAFILGEKSVYCDISISSPTLANHFTRLQFIVICFDRLIDNLAHHAFDGKYNSITLKKLKKIRLDIILHINLHHTTDLKQVFRELVYIIQVGLTELGVHHNTKKMIQSLQENISLTARRYLTDTPCAPKENDKVYPNYPLLIQEGSESQQSGMKVIMCSRDEHWLHSPNFRLDYRYDFQTHFITSSIGGTIDGLWVKKKGVKKKTVVLALVGHFQTEHSYLVNDYTDFYNLFNTDIIFINPRNYSQHGGIKANSIHDIVSDVIDFSDFASEKYKHIILYGMCGGVPFMTLASKELEAQGKSYKIIVDRFSDNYSKIYSVRSIEREFELDGVKQSVGLKRDIERYVKAVKYIPDFSFNLFLRLNIYMFAFVKQIGVVSMGLNFSLSDILKTIPDDKRLVLQAKSKKRQGLPPEFTDMIVHPDDDMRHAFKEVRHPKRVILKKLSSAALALAVKIPGESVLSKELVKLSQIFCACLQTIDNEKLRKNVEKEKKDSTDLHSAKLFSLKTRHDEPIDKFIQAFCLFGSKINKKTIHKLHDKDIDEILHLLNVSLPAFDFTVDMTHCFKDIVDTMYHNRSFIYPLAERVRASGRHDLDAVLKSLESILEPPKEDETLKLLLADAIRCD